MVGTVAITDYGWYDFLSEQADLDEVNFWTPSAFWEFKAAPGSPFFFKLKARFQHSICGFAYFASYSRLPDYLAWEWFGIKNGCESLSAMRDKILKIRNRINYHDKPSSNEIGCILLTSPTFFSSSELIRGPIDWPPANLRHKKYPLDSGEGLRIWQECVSQSHNIELYSSVLSGHVSEDSPRYGSLQAVQTRLGQGTFRVAVMHAYSRACAITGEHSLPALEASHIKPYALSGPHLIQNGILLRADLHRLFDQGYLTITPQHKVEISDRLKVEYDNGKTYYPLHGNSIKPPANVSDGPAGEFLIWHNENVFR